MADAPPIGSILAAGFTAVEQAVRALPPDARGATVVGLTTEGDVSAGAVIRAGDHVTIEGQLALDLEAGKVRNVAGAVHILVVW
jgi:hypothetical protein